MSRRSSFAVWVLAMCWLGLSTCPALAIEGVPDPSFAAGGVATYELGLGTRRPADGFSQFGAIAVSREGQIYVAGTSGDQESKVAALVARVTAHGALDATFAKRGAVIGGQLSWPDAMSVEGSGVTVAGGVQTWFEGGRIRQTTGGFIERLDRGGALDPKFNIHSLPLNVEALQRLPGGGVVVVGDTPEGSPTARRPLRVPAVVEMLLPDGAPDPSFGRRGIVELFDYSGVASGMSAASVLRERNGELVVAGSGFYETPAPTSGPREERHPFRWLARLTPSGALDRSFGEGGMSLPLSGASGLNFGGGPDIVEPRAGGFALVGTTLNEQHPLRQQLTVWGLTERGALDPSYGSQGVAIVPNPPEGREWATAATVDGSDRLLVAGSPGLWTHPELVRITPGGQLDRSFGQEGVAPGPPRSAFNALVVEPSGRVLAAGSLEPEAPEELTAPSVELERIGKQAYDGLIERFLATNSTAAGAQAGVTLLSSRISVGPHDELAIKLACAGASVCRGRLRVTTSLASRRGHSTTRTLGAADFAIRAARHATVKVRFSRDGRRLLRAKHDLPATLTILTVSPRPRRSQDAGVTIV
jgi:uncharacterized delta-60 repeat protein